MCPRKKDGSVCPSPIFFTSASALGCPEESSGLFVYTSSNGPGLIFEGSSALMCIACSTAAECWHAQQSATASNTSCLHSECPHMQAHMHRVREQATRRRLT